MLWRSLPLQTILPIFSRYIWGLVPSFVGPLNVHQDTRQYHSYCPIQWGNRTSEMNYWLGDDVVPLPDINTENPSVSQVYKEWIANFTQEYSIDGFRIDGMFHSLLLLHVPSIMDNVPQLRSECL